VLPKCANSVNSELFELTSIVDPEWFSPDPDPTF
jgi:hypothetical protein